MRYPLNLFQSIKSLILVLTVSVLLGTAHAAVTPVAHWRLGENDAGAVVGGNCLTSIDAVGGRILTNLPSAGPFTRYTNGFGASGRLTSPLALALTNNHFLGGAALSGLTNNFGLEAWVKPATLDGVHAIAYNGDTTFNGWGLFQIGNQYQFLFGGVALSGSATAELNTWAHLAVVNANGVTTLYLNGLATGSLSATPNEPAGAFMLGASPPTGSDEYFQGAIDEVRVFTFAPGAFSTNDLLLYSAPVVATLPATGLIDTNGMLNGTVHPGGLATTAWFEWGPSPYVNDNLTPPVSLGNGVTTLAMSNLLSGFVAGRTYHHRLVASNAAGLVRGKAVPFGTPSITLNNAATITNECHFAFTDPGATAFGAPLAISKAEFNGAAITSERKVVVWGPAVTGLTVVPAGLSNVVAVEGGEAHMLALKSDGTVVAWGYNGIGETIVPDGLTNAVAIAAVWNQSLALKNDGTVVAWGNNATLQTNVPAGLSNVVAIASGRGYNLALKADGTVRGWGSGLSAVPTGLSNVTAIAAAATAALALKSDGTIVAWGGGLANVPQGLSNVVAIAAGFSFCMALKRDGTVIAWGENSAGQTNVPVGLTNVVAIAAGLELSLALKSDGTIVVWGDSNGGPANLNVPADLSKLTVTTGGSVNTNSLGNYTLSYTAATNALGGMATPVTRTVVVRDTIPPVITLNGSNSILYTNLNRIYTDAGATSLDTCNGSLAVNVHNPVNPNIGGTYTVTYTATDSSGNTGTNTRTVFVALPPAVIGDANGDGMVDGAELNAVFANHATNSPFLQMTNTLGLGQTNVTFSLNNSPLGNFSVEYSTNLLNWQPLGPATPRYLFTDTNAPSVPQRYYRLRYP